MTEGRKKKNIKKQQRRGNSYAVEGHAVLNAECLHIDGSVCQRLSVLKINVLLFPLRAPCPAISQLLSFSHFSFLCSSLIPSSDVRHNAIY